MRKSVFQGFGLAFVIWGIFLAVNSYYGITGFFILEDAKLINGNIFNLAFIVVGILLMTLGREEKRKGLETRVRVYDESGGKNKDPDTFYRMTDPKLSLGQAGVVTLGEFKRQIAEFRRDAGGDELVNIVKEEYGPGLRDIAESDDEPRAQIAKEFLSVLGEEIEERDYHLTREEKREIRSVLKEISHGLDNRQKRVLAKYGLADEGKSGRGEHPKLLYLETGNTSPHPDNLGDYRGALNYATDLIKFINNQRDILKRKAKKQ